MRLTTKYGVQHTTNPTITDIVIFTTFRFDVTAVLAGTPTAHGDDRSDRGDDRQRGGSCVRWRPTAKPPGTDAAGDRRDVTK